MLAVGTTINTTPRKQAEQNLFDEKRRFELIFDHSPDLMVISRLQDGYITHVNEAMLKASGYSRDEVIGNSTIGLNVWRDIDDRRRMTEKLARDGECRDVQATFTARDGKQFIGAISAVVVMIDGIPHIVSTVRDITEQLRAEAELQASQTLLRSTLESTDEGILMVSLDGRVLSANQRFAELWRVPSELAASGNDEQLLAHVLEQLSDPQQFLTQVQRLYDSEEEARDVLNFKDGRVFARYTRALAIGAERGRIWCFKDITEQTSAQHALAEREEMFRSIFSQASDGILLIDPTTTEFVEFNDAACANLGYSREEFSHLTIKDIQAEHDAATIAKVNQQVIDTGSMAFETVHWHRDGSKRIVRVSIKPIKLRENIYLVALVSDITERKLMEAALAESNQLLKAVIDTAPVRIFWKDKDLRYMGCNSIFAHDAGLNDPQELIGKDDFQMGWRDQAELYREDDRRVMESGVPKLNFEEPQTTPEGKTIWLSTSKVSLRDADKQIIGILGLYEDITDRKHYESALIASERKLNAVLDNVDAYIYLKDTEGRYLFANRPVLDLWQVGIDEVVGCDDSRFFDAATVENIKRNDAKVLVDGEVVRTEETNTVPVTGVTATYLSTKLPLRDESGRIYALCGISTDITARKLTEDSLLESETRLHLALDAAHMGVWEYNFKTHELYWSDEILQHMQISRVDSLKEYLATIVHPEDREIYPEAMSRAIREHIPYMAVYRLIVNGQLYWTEDRGDIIYDAQGNPLKVIGTAQDITERKLITQALEESEAALRESQIIAGLGNYVLDLHTGIWSSSKLLDRLLGIDEHYVHDVAGWEALIHPEDQQMMHDYFVEEVLGSGRMFDKEYRIVRRTDNAVRWMAGLGRLEFDADGAPCKMLGTIQDITERKLVENELKQTKERYDFSTAVGKIGTWDWNPATGELVWSDETFRLMGFAPGSITPTLELYQSLVHPEDRGLFQSAVQAAMSGEKPFNFDCRIVLASGKEINCNATGRVEFDATHQPIRMLGTIQDITERKLAEDAFKQLNIELEQRVQARTAQLQYANRAKDSFLATMSHEIRTPLGGLLGMLELLGLTRLDQEQRDTLQVAGQSGQSLLRIVDDILDWSKIEAGKLELAPRPSSIAQLLNGVVNTYSQLANAKNIMLHQHVDPQLTGLYSFDLLRISQILNNFTSNAIKFTLQGSVRITAQLLERHNGQVTVRLSVIDSGAGIDLQHQARLFQHYEQASADTARMYGGTGLGLSICRSLADLMGATINVESTIGKGSTFSLTLDLEVVATQAEDVPVTLPTSSVNQSKVLIPLVGTGQVVKLLIVDDHPVNRLLLKQQLGLLGLQVEAATDGVDALALWREENFDLVITDCHMPEMDGYALTAHIRASEVGSGRRVPIIAWTANVLAEEEEHCRIAGMDDILTKPTDLNELRQKLAHWLPQLKTVDGSVSNPIAPVDVPIVLDMKIIAQFSSQHAQQAELLREFDKQNKTDLAHLNDMVLQSDTAAVKSAAHRIKGASRMMGAVQLEQVCLAIETAAARADMHEVRRLVAADLADAAQQLQRAIQRHSLM